MLKLTYLCNLSHAVAMVFTIEDMRRIVRAGASNTVEAATLIAAAEAHSDWDWATLNENEVVPYLRERRGGPSGADGSGTGLTMLLPAFLMHQIHSTIAVYRSS